MSADDILPAITIDDGESDKKKGRLEDENKMPIVFEGLKLVKTVNKLVLYKNLN